MDNNPAKVDFNLTPKWKEGDSKAPNHSRLCQCYTSASDSCCKHFSKSKGENEFRDSSQFVLTDLCKETLSKEALWWAKADSQTATSLWFQLIPLWWSKKEYYEPMGLVTTCTWYCSYAGGGNDSGFSLLCSAQKPLGWAEMVTQNVPKMNVFAVQLLWGKEELSAWLAFTQGELKGFKLREEDEGYMFSRKWN